jgi:ClpP class serine protease
MKEILYCMERDFLERYLKEKARASLDDFKAASDLWGKPIPGPGTDGAVDEIYSVDGNTAHIKIEGPLSNEGPDFWDRFFGYNGASYKTIQAAMERAKNDPAVSRVVLDVDSPGGILDGVDETWQAHKALAAKKPTEVRAGGLLASAAYYISAPAKKIYATAPTSEIGSIGVIVATYDWSKWDDEHGIKKVIITSSKAPDKNNDVSTEHGRGVIQTQLDALERIFYSRVAESRHVTPEHIAEHFGRGGLLVAADPDLETDDAISVGMIDGLTNGDYITGKVFPGPKLTEEQKKEIAAAYEEAIKPGAKFYDSDGKELPPEECEGIRRSLISMETSPSGETNTPATAGKTQEGQNMDLSELLKANPAAAAEFEKLKADAKAEGREEAQADFQKLAVKCTAVLEGKAYPDAVRVKACQALRGESSIEAFEAVQSTADMIAEQMKSKDAQAETQAAGGVTAQAPNLTPAAEQELDVEIAADLAKRKEKK